MADDQFSGALQRTLEKARGQMLVAAEQANRAIAARDRPTGVVRAIGGAVAAADVAYTAVQVIRVGQAVVRRAPRIEYRYSYLQDVIGFALSVLRELSPVGEDEHAGLYRDSHVVFVDGRLTADFSTIRPDSIIHISTAVPYARKIELGRMLMRVPGHVYEAAAQLVAGRYGNQAAVKFTFMPVRFGGVADFAAFSRRLRPGRRRMSEKARRDWLVRQPALEIKAR